MLLKNKFSLKLVRYLFIFVSTKKLCAPLNRIRCLSWLPPKPISYMKVILWNYFMKISMRIFTWKNKLFEYHFQKFFNRIKIWLNVLYTLIYISIYYFSYFNLKKAIFYKHDFFRARKIANTFYGLIKIHV